MNSEISYGLLDTVMHCVYLIVCLFVYSFEFLFAWVLHRLPNRITVQMTCLLLFTLVLGGRIGRLWMRLTIYSRYIRLSSTDE